MKKNKERIIWSTSNWEETNTNRWHRNKGIGYVRQRNVHTGYRGSFERYLSTDESVKKSVYLSIQEISKKWSMPIRDWGIIIGQLMIFFEDRFQENYASWDMDLVAPAPKPLGVYRFGFQNGGKNTDYFILPIYFSIFFIFFLLNVL